MDAAYFKEVVSQLEAGGAGFESGLSDEEVRAVERHFGFVFPPDLRAFLQFALPVSTLHKPWGTRRSLFSNWLTPDEEQIRKDLERPLEGMYFDIEHNLLEARMGRASRLTRSGFRSGA